MLRPYRDVLATRGAAAFVGAGFLARLPISMLGIGNVLLVSGTMGSYGLAGAVAAVYGVAQAVASPQVSRLVDRYGQARVMRPALAVQAGGLLALVALASSRAPAWTLFPAAVTAALGTGSVGALVRARWSSALREPQALHTAYSLESVLDEVIFIVGPILVTLLSTRVAPGAGLLAAVAAAVTGTLLLTAQRATEPPVHPDRHTGTGSVLRSPALLVVVAVFLLVGAVFGSVEVTAVAFTDERGVRGSAGLVLACFALGSMVAGLGYGTVHWRRPPGSRLAWGVAALTVGVVPFALVTSVRPLALAMTIAGVAISPLIIAGNSVVELAVPPGRLTEGITWAFTAIGLGASAGTAVAGWVVDTADAHRAFLVPVAAAVLALLTVGLGSPALSRTARPAPRGALAADAPRLAESGPS